MYSKSIGFIGGGRITTIFLCAMKDAGMKLDRVTVSDVSWDALAKLKTRFPEIHTSDDNRVSAAGDLVILALPRPAINKETLSAISGHLTSDAVFLSLAPEFTLAKLTELLGGFERIARMIPNAPSMIREGFNPVSYSQALSVERRAELEKFFDGFGPHPVVGEDKLEAYAILTAMAPAYFWYQWQALRELGIEFGLDAAETDAALLEMIRGAAKMLLESGLPFQAVNHMIPGKPFADVEDTIQGLYREKLIPLYWKLKGD